MISASSAPSGRMHHLDALRGLAASVVVLFHLWKILTVVEIPLLLLPFLEGNKCVVLFFVLSGYVLSLPYWDGKRSSYRTYFIRRVCRVYLPFAGAVLIAALFASILQGANLPLTAVFYNSWHEPITFRLVIHQMLFGDGGKELAPLNLAFWTLKFEMIISLIFPLICWGLSAPTLVGVTFALGMSYEVLGAHRFTGELGSFAGWTAAFMMGALLAKEQEPLHTWFRELTVMSRYTLLVLIVLGFYYGRDKSFINLPAACGVILLANSSRVGRWLSTAPFRYLGRISYSLYLLHCTVLFAVFIVLYGKIPLWAVSMTYVAVSFGSSHLYSKYIEDTSMSLGKRLTSL